MTARIELLSPLLANQIAAGEVIERPASVVKELIENSLDAGATEIEIEIEKGGSRLIRVRDNGIGIHPKDLPLALSRHATSKIKQPEDLEAIATLGFRGEALASIASVSRLMITSACEGESGWKISCEGTVMEATAMPAAHPRGTSLEVWDLFFNTPARRKFLRSEKTEFDHIDECVKRIAMTSFSTGFTLKHNQRLIRQYFPLEDKTTHYQERLSSLCGSLFVEQSLYMEAEVAGMNLSGWIGLPHFSRSQADLQYCFVNGRLVRNKIMSHAIREAYQDVLYRGRYPAYVLFLTVPLPEVDVNVHPTKHEVRFRDSRRVHDFILRSLQDVLAKSHHSSSLQEVSTEEVVEEMKVNNPPIYVDTQVRENNSSRFTPPKFTPSSYPAFKKPSIQMQMAVYKTLHEKESNESINENEEIVTPPLGYALGQLHQIYILAENDSGLVMVDMHAAHERILYEKLKTAFDQGSLVAQNLLVPLTLTLSEREATFIEEVSLNLEKLGFTIEKLGPSTVAIRAVPSLLASEPIEQLVRDTITDLIEHGKSTAFQEAVYHLLATLACRSAIHARRKLSLPEMNALLREMEKTPHSGYCNHGRPTVKQYSLAELDKIFMRGQ